MARASVYSNNMLQYYINKTIIFAYDIVSNSISHSIEKLIDTKIRVNS